MLALVRLLSSVQSLVTLECGSLTEGSMAVTTSVGPLPSVDACVGPQAALREEHPLAFLAVPCCAVLTPGEHAIH